MSERHFLLISQEINVLVYVRDFHYDLLRTTAITSHICGAKEKLRTIKYLINILAYIVNN